MVGAAAGAEASLGAGGPGVAWWGSMPSRGCGWEDAGVAASDMRAAISHAPLTAIFLTVEMTHSYACLPFVGLATAIAYFTAKTMLPHSIMTAKFHRKH